jgi:hypothetical protein
MGTSLRHCEEAIFTSAIVRIAIEPDTTWGTNHPRFTARLFVSEPSQVRPITDAGGRPVSIMAESEPLAFSSAIGFLEHEFGTFTQMTHPCPEARPEGTPYVALRYRVSPPVAPAQPSAPVATLQ